MEFSFPKLRKFTFPKIKKFNLKKIKRFKLKNIKPHSLKLEFNRFNVFKVSFFVFNIVFGVSCFFIAIIT